MRVCLMVLGIVLAGQVAASGDRYGQPVSGTGDFNSANSGTSNQTQWLDPPAASQPPAAQPRQPQVQPRQTNPPQAGGGYPAAQPLARTPSSATPRSKPSDLYRKLLSPPISNPLPGTAIRLADVLRGAKSRNEQTSRIEAYWDLTAAVTDYHLSLLELTELSTLRASVSQPSQRWQEASQIFSGRVQVSQRSAMSAQLRLLTLMGQSTHSSLPTPGDLPHCGAYDTRYDEIFGSRPSRYAEQLHELLPLRYHDLRRQAAGVSAARNWLDTVSSRRSQQTDGTGLLKAHELLILRRRAFVYTVRDYNLQIARYSELASPGEVGSDRLVSMLIRVAKNRRGAWSRPEVEQTTAIEELRASNQPPQTFAPATPGNSTRETPSQFQPQRLRTERRETNPNGERSIIVQP